MMYHPVTSVCFKGYTLIVPSVSVGNVGQLSVDLLISSLECVKSGFLWHKAVLPIVGANPYKSASPSLALGAEVYYSDEKKLVLVQLRSSVCKTFQNDFFEEFLKWVKSEEILQVVVLTGSSNEERIDGQITSEPFRYIMCSKSASMLSTTFSELGWITLEKRLRFPALPNSGVEDNRELKGKLIIPGGGFAKKLYDLCCSSDVPCITLIKFCSEGDNIPDALTLSNKLNSWLQVLHDHKGNNKDWIFPPSWMFLFGNPPPKQLY